MRHFLPWSAPFLPAVAARLLEECVAAAPHSFDADLSQSVIVVRGRNAGRRLLGLLAQAAQSRGKALIPPRIVTPGSLDSVLLENREPVAGALMQRLAWTRAVKEASPALLDAVWESPSAQDRTATLGRFLDQTWRELSTSGHDFETAYPLLCQVAPDASVHEENRWNALGRLLREYRECLKTWGCLDPADFRQSRKPAAKAQISLVGVVELSPALVSILQKLPTPPHIFIHAPESESGGFDPWGRLIPGYWQRRPCRFEQGEIHLVADGEQQAERCAELIKKWRMHGVGESAVTVAVLESEATATLDHRLRDHGIPVRLAEGRPATHSTVVQLLAALAECLDTPPLYAALARLARHPDIAAMLGHPAKRLDQYFNAHLPLRVVPFEGDERIRELVAKVRDFTAIRSGTFGEDLTRLLLRIYGERRLNRFNEADRAVIHGLEAVQTALDEMQEIPREALAAFSPSELLHGIVEAAASTGIPSPEMPDAVELAGWLEAAADDSPALIVTSVFEGSLPEGSSAEPLLHDRLRDRLGLPCRASRYARDQYTLWTVMQSRRENGQLALIAPRRNAAGDPTRPSRLLIAGHEDEALATRLMALSRIPNTPTASIPGGMGFEPPLPEPEVMRAFRIFRPTSFRTYLESPRFFYFNTVLGLTDQTDDAQELDGALFGTTIHAILREYGEWHLNENARPTVAEIEAELEPLLIKCMEQTFGRHALPPVHTQRLALWERLRRFAQHQAQAFEEGWQIAYVESDDSLFVPFEVEGAPEDVQLKGKIDRIDWHPDGRWRVIDYKTAAKAKSPKKAHYSEKSGWKDLQLPLYLKLLPAIGSLQNGPVDPERTELVYFNLPAELDQSSITEPLPPDLIPDGLAEAEAIVREVCSGNGCQEIGKMAYPPDPALAALCGLNGLFISPEEEEEL
jgi:ATP-dependent helicase/nuclease subunit B